MWTTAPRSRRKSATKPLRRVRWMPFPTAAGTQKSGSEPLGIPEGREPEVRFYAAAPGGQAITDTQSGTDAPSLRSIPARRTRAHASAGRLDQIRGLTLIVSAAITDGLSVSNNWPSCPDRSDCRGRARCVARGGGNCGRYSREIMFNLRAFYGLPAAFPSWLPASAARLA